MKLRKLLAATAFVALSTICFKSYATTIGLAMPTQEEPKWYDEGFLLESKLKRAGFDVELFFGGSWDVALQQKQIQRLTDQNVDVLVIAALDGSALTNVLEKSKSKNIPVISYDRLITNSNAVSYYATFDNELVGKMQGQYIVDKLDLANSTDTKNLEIFCGSLDDNNATFFYKGAMSVLEPYIQSGALKVLSGQITPQDTQIQGWLTDGANKRMGDLINKVGYGPKGVKLDAILSPADCLSAGIVTAMKKSGYSSADFPIITGQDASDDGIARIKDGEQSMTIYKDSNDLCDAVVDMIKKIQSSSTVTINDTSTYDNGTGIIPSFLCEPKQIDITNINSVR